tara:strand:- start:630 stop:1784 length:1155 start_codon:yes stop_codon:yes gene_type:complete
MADLLSELQNAAGWKAEGRRLAVEPLMVTAKDAARFIAEMTPVLGDVMAAKELWDEATSENPNWVMVGALGGAAVIGLIPGIGDAAAKGIKAGAKKMLGSAKRVEADPNTLGSMSDNVRLKPMGDAPSPAQEVAGLLASGRVDEITDEMLGKLTTNDNMELFELYQSGATGMDLPMDEASRIQRADERSMVRGYHGTMPSDADYIYGQTADNPDIVGFDINRSTRGQSGKGIYFAPEHNIELANKFAGGRSLSADELKRLDPDSRKIQGVVYPAMVKADNQANFEQMRKAQYDYETAQNSQGKSAGYAGLSDTVLETLKPQGFSGVNQKHEFTTFNPENVRSRFARFDPRLAHLKNLSASIGIAPLGLLALLQEQERNQEGLNF